MTTQTLVITLDDLDGRTGDDIQTIFFGLDGFEYEIDLRAHNAAMLREMFAPYAAVARRARRGTETRTGRQGISTVAIRAWARGIPVADRGRTATEVHRRYEAETALALQQVLPAVPCPALLRASPQRA